VQVCNIIHKYVNGIDRYLVRTAIRVRPKGRGGRLDGGLVGWRVAFFQSRRKTAVTIDNGVVSYIITVTAAAAGNTCVRAKSPQQYDDDIATCCTVECGSNTDSSPQKEAVRWPSRRHVGRGGGGQRRRRRCNIIIVVVR